LATGILLARPGKKLQKYTIFALAMALIAVGMSLSRGAWVGIALAVAVMMVFWSHHSRILLAAAAVSSAPLGAMAFLNVLPAEVADRLATALDYFRFVDVTQEVVTPQNYAVLERVAHWQAAINMIAANPLFGVGAGNYPAVYDTYSVRGWNEALGHAHNFYLNIAAETGFIGLAIYLSIFVIAFLHITKWLTQPGWEQPREGLRAAGLQIAVSSSLPRSQELLWRGILAGVLGSLVASCIHNMFDSLFVHGMSIQLGMILALGQLSTAALARSTVRSRPNS